MSACSEHAASPAAGSAAPSGDRSFVSKRFGVRLDYPDDLKLRHSFQGSYLAADGWKTYLGPNAPPGQALAAMVLPESNAVTAGELRVGVSRDPTAVKKCTQLPDAARPGTRKQVTLGGVSFTRFTAADAAMSHYLVVKSFRGVHADTCYALDALVFGTNPQVYDPPKTPPFSRKQAFERLMPVVHSLQFLDTGTAQGRAN